MLMLPGPFQPTTKSNVSCAHHLTAQTLHMLRSSLAVNSGQLAGYVSSPDSQCTPRNHVAELLRQKLKCIVVTSDSEYFGQAETVVHTPITIKDIPWLFNKKASLVVASIKSRAGKISCVLVYNWDTSSGIVDVYTPHVGTASKVRFRELGDMLQRSEPLVGVRL